MAKRRAGLHKEIASIFDGAPVLGKSASGQTPAVSLPQKPGYEQDQKLNKAGYRTAVAPKPPVPSLSVTETAKRQTPEPAAPKAAQRKASRPKTARKNTRESSWQQSFRRIKEKFLAPKPGVSATRQKAMVVLVPVLFIAFIFVFIKVLTPSVSGTRASTKPVPTNAAQQADKKLDWKLPALYPTNIRNPMQLVSVVTADSGTGDLVVKGTVHDENNPLAIIGKKIVHVGDTIAGVKIIKITKDSVTFEKNGKTWTQKVE